MSDIKKYNTRAELLALIPENSKVVEIGVFRGGFSKEIIKNVKFSEFYMVDIWLGSWGSGDKDGKDHINIDNMEDVYLALYQQTKDKPNIHVVRAGSIPFLKSSEDDYFDVVYVDGDHTAQAVYNDLVESFKKIKNGGLLMGHDYHYTIGGDVVYAVTKFCQEYKQTIECIADDGCPSFVIRVNKQN